MTRATPVAVEPFDPAACAAADLERWYACHLAATRRDLPRDPEPTPEAVLGLLRHNRHRQAAWVARDAAGAVVGTAKAVLDDGTNTHLAEVELVVDPEHRRRGGGRALLTVVAAAVAGEGRTTLLLEARDGGDGEAFARAVGAERALTERRSVQRLPADDSALVGLCRDAVAAVEAKGYRLVSWTDRCPDDLLEGAAAAQASMTSAPLGALDYTWETWTPQMLRDEEAASARRGFAMHVTVAVAPGGEVVGLTETSVHRTQRVRGYQGNTGVLSASRGQGLGLALKAAQLLRLRRLEPALREVETWNAESNAFMLRINTLLGYEREDTFSEWQLRVRAVSR